MIVLQHSLTQIRPSLHRLTYSGVGSVPEFRALGVGSVPFSCPYGLEIALLNPTEPCIFKRWA